MRGGCNVEGKVALITGAGSGLGRSMAMSFADAGARVIVADINLSGAEATAAAIGEKALALPVDVGDEDSVDQLVRGAIDAFAHIDILCNNAGISDSLALPAKVTLKEWNRVMHVNLTGPFLMSRAVLPHMLGQGSGSIINIGSEACIRGGVTGAPYTASKHGLLGLTRNIAWVYRNEGIRCNAVLPGITRTGRVSGNTEIDKEGMARFKPIHDLQEIWAEPQHMADVVLFLASDAASFINGACIPVDGGWAAG